VRVKKQEISTTYLSPSPSSPPARGGEILFFTKSSNISSTEKGGESEEGFNDINIFGLDSRGYKPLLYGRCKRYDPGRDSD
jgi:hypothetical protein